MSSILALASLLKNMLELGMTTLTSILKDFNNLNEDDSIMELKEATWKNRVQ
jgi:hypothetical protein